MNKYLIGIIWLLSSLLVNGQEMTVAERNAAQGFNDTIDRLDPDFVKVSLCYAEPTKSNNDLFGIVGHCFLRLQCSSFGLDYCFSYESEVVNAQLDKFLVGALEMGMFSIPTNEYLADYREWHRAVHEYRLNLPPDSEQRLWEMLDKEVLKGPHQKFDLIKHGCGISIVHFIEKAIAPTQIEYSYWPSHFDKSRREILRMHLIGYPWERLVIFTLFGRTYDEECPKKEKLICPDDIIDTWSHATIDGQPLLTYIGDIVEYPSVTHKEPFSPMICMWLIVLLTIVFIIINWNEWNYILTGAQCVLGLLLLFLYYVSSVADSPNLWQLVLYNPLPLLLWHWRRYWQIPYTCILLIWIIVSMAFPYSMVENEHLVFALAVALYMSKDWLRDKYNYVISHKSK